MREFKSILVIQWAGLGDMVLATPALAALRVLYPHTHIGVLTNSRALEIIKDSKDVDEIFVADRLSDFRRILKEVRHQRFDAVINFYRLFSFAGAIKMLILFWTTKAKFWIGRNTNHRGFFYHLKVAEHLPDEKHEVEHKLDIVRALGGEVKDIIFKVDCTQEDEKFVQGLLAQEGVGAEDILIGINCATFVPARNWPVRRYSQLAELLLQKFSAKVAFCARDIDREMFKRISSHISGKVTDLVGKLTVGQLIAFIKHCRIFISSDSGPMHIAAALKIPLVSLFGTGEYEELRPYGNERSIRILRTPLKTLTAIEVIQAVSELI